MNPNVIEKVALAITDCEAAGPIHFSAAKVVARNVVEALRDCGEELMRGMNPGSARLARCYWRQMMTRALNDALPASAPRDAGG